MSSFPAYFYKFKKRTNSTERPDASTLLHTLNVSLKAGSSIVNPTLEIAFGSTFSGAVDVNYCHIPAFNRYYFVNNTVYERGIWYLTLSVDVMASYRDEIGADNRFIVRAANEKVERRSRDFEKQYIGVESIRNSDTKSFTSSFGQGSFILGVNNGESGGIHLNYYILSQAQFAKFNETLWSDNLKDISVDLVNPLQYIVSCMWLPFSPAAIHEHIPLTAGITSIPFAWTSVDLGGTAYRLITGCGHTYSSNGSMTIPKSVTAQYLNSPPFARYKAYFGPFGTIPLDGNIMAINSTLYYVIDIDLTTGEGVLRLSTDSNIKTWVYMANAQCGVMIPLSQATTNIGGILSGVGSVIGGIATGNVLGVAGGALGLVDAFSPNVQSVGNVGGTLKYRYPAFIQADFQRLDDNGTNGYLVNERWTISDIPGFIVCGHGYTRISGTSVEYDEVNRIMKEGFYFA